MAGLVDSVYQKSPVWAQQAMVAAYGVWWYRRRFNPRFHALVAEYKARERWSAAQFTRLQDELLGQLLSAADGSRYYGPLLAGSRGKPPRERLASLPFLEKDTLRVRPKDSLTREPERGTMVYRSSGTTGTPSEIYYTKEFHSLELAVPEARNLAWAGLDYKDRRAMFGVRKVCRHDQSEPPFWRQSPAENLAYFSVYHLSPRHMPAYLDYLREFRPAVLMGYPSSLVTLARFALETKANLPPARGIFTTSETVSDDIRADCEAAFGCKIWDRYGAVENCLFASQCEHGRYHVSPEVGIIEILDAAGKPCGPGQLGEVVATGLQNDLQPLIRYRIGDAARWALEQSCACGRDMPILEAVEGRYEDMCFTPDGRQVLRFDTVFKGVASLREAQVVQEAIDRYKILVVPAEGFGDGDVATLQANMRLHVGGAVTTLVEKVDTIPRTAAGKFRAVVCRLSAEEKRAARSLSA